MSCLTAVYHFIGYVDLSHDTFVLTTACRDSIKFPGIKIVASREKILEN